MGKYIEIEGDIIDLAKNNSFDVIVQGNNCFCTQGAGLAPQMVEAFGTDRFVMEHINFKGDINKLGIIDIEGRYKENWKTKSTPQMGRNYDLYVVNAYTQYNFGLNHINGILKPLDYEALTLCLRKINKIFKGKHIGLPQIGAGLAGGDWERIKQIIQTELKDCDTTIVIYNKNKYENKTVI